MRTVVLLFFFSFCLGTANAEHAGSGSDDAMLIAVTNDMVTAAKAIIGTMSDGPGGIELAVGYDRSALLALDYSDEARTNYVYWPYLRKGLPLQYMTAQQKTLTHELLNSALSAKGYLSAIQIMQLEKLLADDEVVGFPRGTEKYTLAIFGEPDTDNHWGWRFEGHHLSLNFTLAPGEISVTPSFYGASPAQIRTGALAGYRTRADIHFAGLNLMNALNEDQRQQATLPGNPPFDIVSGTLNKPMESWDEWRSIEEKGIALIELTAAQKQLAQRIIDEVISAYRPEISQSYLNQIDINALHFAWIGETTENAPHYWRLDGPDFFFEYDLVQGNGNHVHTVWRSKHGDFGADLLMQHRMSNH